MESAGARQEAAAAAPAPGRLTATRTVAARKLAARGRGGKFDPVLWVILGAFVVYEVFAVATGNRDAHSLSNRIAAFEKWAGWPGYAAVAGVLLVVLPLHLLVHAF